MRNGEQAEWRIGLRHNQERHTRNDQRIGRGLRKDKVQVNSISPGSVHTPLLEFAAQEVVGQGNDIEPKIAEFGAAHPIGRVGTAEETSKLMAFLISDRSGFCTGGDYLVDGGLLAHLGV